MSDKSSALSLRRKRLKTDVDLLACKPLDSYDEIIAFSEKPPLWRTLCKELVPHSKCVIRNIERNLLSEPTLESPVNFCHFNPERATATRYDSTKEKLPKTLVCHDMANGYHDDSLIDGSVKHDQYTFYNWAGIDIFCYFSHHLVTIPPLSWINVGHAHGVKVIGTIITEWAAGVPFWDQVLDSESSYQEFVHALVAIAKTLKFDGWLLNIENKITKPDILLDFVKHLHKSLHEELPHPVLIWYDSVTTSGNLNWQNGITDKNKAFFDKCDGFFTNYSWTLADIEKTVKLAGDRVTDVYVGIDVWGRNFYGDGQFNVQTAIKVAHKEGLSLAIFAPAWTHEAMSNDPQDSNYITLGQDYDNLHKFLLRDRALWGSIWPYLYTHVPCKLPFQTSFCKGQGKKRWSYGEMISPGPWYNLRRQQYQLNAAHGSHGYLLSTHTKLRHLSLLATQHDRRGIIRYRQSFKDQVAIKSAEECSLRDAATAHDADGEDDDDHDHCEHDTDVTCLCFETASEPAMSSSTSTTKKISRIIKRIYRGQTSTTRSLSPEQERMNMVHPDVLPASVEFTETDAKSDEPAATRSVYHNEDALQESELALSTDIAPKEKEDPMATMSVSINLKKDVKVHYGLAAVPDERECVETYYEDGFHGGSCVRVNPPSGQFPDEWQMRLFHCNFYCESSLIFCVVSKPFAEAPRQNLNLCLSMNNVHGKELSVRLQGHWVAAGSALDGDSAGYQYVYPLFEEEQESFRDLRQYLLRHEPAFYVPIENFYGWEVKYYEVHVPGSTLRSINCKLEQDHGSILLGHLGVCHRYRDKD